MAKTTVVYPSFKGALAPLSDPVRGEIFEWENNFWIMTDEKTFVKLPHGTLVPTNEAENEEERVIILNDAHSSPYED